MNIASLRVGAASGDSCREERRPSTARSWPLAPRAGNASASSARTTGSATTAWISARATDTVEFRAAAYPGAGGQIELRLDKADGELLGTCDVAVTGDWQKWQSFTAKIKPTAGKKNLCLVFKSLPQAKAVMPANNTVIYAQFPGVNPNESTVEINVRHTVFTPDKTNINYITVRGFDLRNAATPLGAAHRRRRSASSPPTGAKAGSSRTTKSATRAAAASRWANTATSGTTQRRRHRRCLHRLRPPRAEQRLEQGDRRQPPRPQQPHPPLRADRRRRQPRLRVQHRHRQRHPRHPSPPALRRRGNGRHQVPRRDRCRHQPQPHLPLRRRRRHLARLDGPGHPGDRQPAARQRGRCGDIFFEMQHGPFLVANNLLLSKAPPSLSMPRALPLCPQPDRGSD